MQNADPPDGAPEARLAESWRANADAWTSAVRSGGIESRRRVTDAAIVEAVCALRPSRVLDLGCGEGWLVRALAKRGVRADGVDASGPLVEAARADGGGRFEEASYEALAARPGLLPGPYDVVVANFALLHEDAAPVLRSLHGRLSGRGRLVVQTVHPWASGAPYRDGWRTEDFRGFGDEAGWRPMPWYFRTMEGWTALLGTAGFGVETLREPRLPETDRPCALLVTARPLSR